MWIRLNNSLMDVDKNRDKTMVIPFIMGRQNSSVIGLVSDVIVNVFFIA